MLRILFIILALVTTVLALVLNQIVLYAAAAVLLVIAAVLVIRSVGRRRKKAREPYTRPPVEPASEDDDLASLGILEIRTKSGEPAGPGVGEGAPAAAQRGAAAEQAAPRSTGAGERDRPTARDTVMVRKKGPGTRMAFDEAAGDRYRDVVGPYLQSMQAALSAQTVCLLTQEHSPLHYRIQAIVSDNAYARSGGTFSTPVPLLNASEARRAVTLRRVGGEDLSRESLGYYRESIAVKQVALAPVPSKDDTLTFLVVDTMTDRGLSGAYIEEVLSRFAATLAPLLSPAAEEPSSAATDKMRPRRDIIAEEMEKARAKGKPLALALVWLRNAEAVAAGGETAVAEVQEQLAHHLAESTPKGRVELFGELTYGVFVNQAAGDVEQWALALHDRFAEMDGHFAGGVSIGVAMLAERHEDVEALRRDATQALREAYASGACTILE